MKRLIAAIAAAMLATSANAAPANDNFANATVISGTDGSITGTTAGATMEPGEPYYAEAQAVGYNIYSVWYKWTAPAGVNAAAFYIADYGYNMGVVVYTGNSLNALHEIDLYVNDEMTEGYRGLNYVVYSCDVFAGQTYYICVMSAFGGGEFRLGWKAANGFAPVVDDGIMLGFVGNCPKNLTIPNTVTWIAPVALGFFNEENESVVNLESVVIPESVAGIGEYAFRYCENLSSITFNDDGLYVIEDKAFMGCDALAGKTLELPMSLTDITGHAFDYINTCYEPLTVIAPSHVEDTLYSGTYEGTELNVEYGIYAINGRVNVWLHPEGGEFGRGLSLAGRILNGGSTVVAVWKNKADWSNAISRKPRKAGYVFDGFWTSASGGVQIWDADMKYVGGTDYWNADGTWLGRYVSISMDAYAHWKPVASAGIWTLKYHSNNGKNDLDTQNFKVGEEKRLYYMNSRLGWEYKDEDGFNYIFLGWAKSPTGGVAYENGALVKDLADKGKVMHIYAVWQKRAYNVCFHSNDEDGLVEYQEFRPNIAKNLYWLDSGLGWTRPGYDFLGWAKAPTSTAVVYTNGQKVNNLVAQGQTLHLYAVWRDRRWTIRYHRNYTSGDNTYEDQKIPVGASVKLRYLDSQLKWTRDGYWFKGWAKSRTAGAAYQNGQTVKDLVPGGQVLHLYGAWGKKSK